MNRGRLWALGWVVAMTGCAVDLGEPSERLVVNAISGGVIDETNTSVVALVRIDDGTSICSGTVIAPNVILTAQHCVAPVLDEHPEGGVICGQSRFGPAYPASVFRYTTATRAWSAEAIYRPIAGLSVPDGAMFCGNDIALLVLADPVDVSVVSPSVPRVDEPLNVPFPGGPQTGEAYSAVGYGQANAGTNSSGVRRRRDGLFAWCGEGSCGYPLRRAVKETEWYGDTGVCRGDSGGPALDTSGRVIGVASRGGAECSGPVYASVYAWRAWLSDEVERITTEAGLQPPGWALGFPTAPQYAFSYGQSCGTDEACPSGVCMLQSYCTRRCDDEVAPCGEDFFCNAADYCMLREVGAPCQEDGDCDQGRGCHQGHCTRGCSGGQWSCPDGWFCHPDSDRCELKPVGKGCLSDDACDGGVCESGLCTRACHAQATCPDGWSCSAGQCALVDVGGDCDGDEDCSVDGRCAAEFGRCTRSCGATAPCPSGWVCGDTGACRPDDDAPCLDGRDCASTPMCDNDSCADVTVDSGCRGGGPVGPAECIVIGGLWYLCRRRRC